MKLFQFQRLYFLNILLLFILPFRTGLAQEEINPALIDTDSWLTEQLTPGLTWKYKHFDSLFQSKQSINILEIDLAHSLEMKVVYLDSGLQKTSVFGEQNDALAAINGTFFNIKEGGSVCLLMANSKIINVNDPALNPQHGNGIIAMDSNKKVSVIATPEGGTESLKSFQEVMSSGPLLLQNGAFMELVQDKFNLNRHPRTAVGITDDNHLVLLTADGRNAEAAGLSTKELAEFMKALGCMDALNLDGGGSTTLWTKSKGVVNFPSDNKSFDHEGEREVANALVIRR
ncbi:phosphodiester glycosidase family protein [Fulvivirga sp. M361]|uniref:phosphodiester glycosidase family protein n=1 Tax=Fulvivirga sp. M361 TaxID=2594266 RepID=UPI001628D6CF|nr:phosphodiester glycosidase family protein [Fulvivirga sp. M361]